MWVGIRLCCHHLYVHVYSPIIAQSIRVAPYISPQAQNPLERERLLGRSRVSLMWAVNVMAIQSRDKKPSLSVS